ncbi:penicillin-binding protein 2 [Glycocaulis profundi]|nr:penicillin-binding protein 2 [Glycocaulis profundi]
MRRLLARLFGKVEVREEARGPAPLPVREAAPADVTRLLRLEDETSAVMSTSRRRFRVMGLVIGGAFVLMLGRAVELAVVGEFTEAAPPMIAQGPVRRGDILDRNGVILATNLDFHSLYGDPRYVWDAADTAAQLATVLPGLDVERVTRDLSGNGRFIWIARGLTPRQRQAIHLLGLPGIGFRIEPGRLYPKSRTAAHIVGYTDRDLSGIAGAELAFNAELTEGSGRPVSLSIDLTAQHAVEDVLRERIERYSAAAGMAVLMRVGTGEVVALASMPDYDPNRAAEASDDARYNRPLAGVYELGSVFKPLALAAGIESGRIRLDDPLDARHPIVIGGHRIRDFRPQARVMTAREMVVHSSNIAAARMAERMGTETLVGFYEDLNLFQRAPIELNESARPILPRRWGPVETMTAAYGHGFNVSPLSLAAAFGALANEGVYVPPTLRPVGPGDIVTEHPVMSAGTAAQVLGAMRAAVSGGQADREGLAIAGKTGTAQRIVNGRYEVGNVMTSFVGIFPFDDPQYVLIVTLDQPRPIRETHGFNTAGWNAAPTGGEIIERVAPILGVGQRRPDPAARASVVAQMFSPRLQARPGPEEPLEDVRAAAGGPGAGEGARQ